MTKNLLLGLMEYICQYTNRLWLLLLIVIGFTVACGNDYAKTTPEASVPERLQPLYQEILQIHDEVMPEMNQISKLQNSLSSQLDTLRNQEPVNKEKLKETNRMLGELNRAENAMWSWMHRFAKLDSVPVDDKEKFLRAEKSSANSMKDLMLRSIEDANEYLKANEEPGD
ncbi:MAG: hypothetical protein HKN87_00645 [Saprospiraceae bacterium]|nr:hypothetical protein [Saprospiraceae bacterium]